MHQFRLTKYDPAHRDCQGAYLREEWTSSAQIGRSFGGVVLTEAEVQRVEEAYAISAVEFLREAGVVSLTVTGLENPRGLELPFSEGTSLALEEVAGVLRRVLREEFWCRLEGEQAFVHIDWDYYLFLGVPIPCPAAEAAALRRGLFPEPFPSPHLQPGPADQDGGLPSEIPPGSSP
ncbi:hypothetical protein NZK32_10640 [Cyanobium sp. FGCU-52]|nr:hypothetical protein [Cyanobium sp. FGCU52]